MVPIVISKETWSSDAEKARGGWREGFLKKSRKKCGEKQTAAPKESSDLSRPLPLAFFSPFYGAALYRFPLCQRLSRRVPLSPISCLIVLCHTAAAAKAKRDSIILFWSRRVSLFFSLSLDLAVSRPSLVFRSIEPILQSFREGHTSRHFI